MEKNTGKYYLTSPKNDLLQLLKRRIMREKKMQNKIFGKLIYFCAILNHSVLRKLQSLTVCCKKKKKLRFPTNSQP